MRENLLTPNKREATAAERERYQRMTGSIIFLIVETRPDITFTTLVMSHFAKNPSHQHNKAIKTIFQYLKAIKETEIIYGGEQRKDLIIKG